MASGKDIADRAPPPSKLKGYGSGGGSAAPEAAEEGEGDEEETKAVAVSQMQEFMDAAGINGDAAELCRLLEQYLDTAGYRRG